MPALSDAVVSGEAVSDEVALPISAATVSDVASVVAVLAVSSAVPVMVVSKVGSADTDDFAVVPPCISILSPQETSAAEQRSNASAMTSDKNFFIGISSASHLLLR